jgi:hypothetical protein
MVERGGRVRLRVIPTRRGPALSREVRANVNPNSIIFTDDWQAYKALKVEYIDHRIINHSAGMYVDHRIAALPAVLPERVRVALQRPSRRQGDVRAATAARRRLRTNGAPVRP